MTILTATLQKDRFMVGIIHEASSIGIEPGGVACGHRLSGLVQRRYLLEHTNPVSFHWILRSADW